MICNISIIVLNPGWCRLASVPIIVGTGSLRKEYKNILPLQILETVHPNEHRAKYQELHSKSHSDFTRLLTVSC